MLGFSPMICEFQGWAQGGLGMLVLGAGLLFAIALMVYLRWTGAIPYVLGGALAMYYGVPVIESMFHWNQDCAVVRSRFAQEENYANNTRYCEDHLFSVDDQTGEDCSCNGESATPQCESYNAICTNQLSSYENSSNYCTCGFANQTQNSTPECQTVDQSSPIPDSLNVSQACYSRTSTGGWPNVAAVCSDPEYQTLQTAQWMGPTPDFDNSANGAAYYTYQTVLDNPTNAPVDAYWYGESDNTGWYFDNGQQVGYSTSWSAGNKIPIVLQPGENTLDVTVQNSPNSESGPLYGPNPTGTIDKITSLSGNSTYSQTGGNAWQEVSGPPATPNPPPSGPTVNCYTQSCAG